MAPPPGQQARPGRQIAVLALLFVILYLLVLFVGTGKLDWGERFQPKLGLDLIGGTRVTFLAVTKDGSPPPGDQLEQARLILERRVNAYGVSEAEVVTEGDRNIVISLPGESDERLKTIGAAAQLRFRKVIDRTEDTPDVEPEPTPTATPTPTGTASPTATTTPTAAATPTPTATGTPSASATGTPAPTGTAAPTNSPRPGQADVEREVGPAAWQAAMALTAPVALGQDPAQAAVLAPFRDLDALQVAALPANIQFNVPFVTCAKLDQRPPGSIEDEKVPAVACETGAKYLLDKGKVLGTDVSGASSSIDPQTSQWVVNLDFTGDGQDRWTKLTQEAVANTTEPKCNTQNAVGDKGNCLVAVVLDNEVVSAPEIEQVITSSARISGQFTKRTADELAGQLRFGALPLTFEQQEAQSVSASLGADHLKAGLLAAGIGMLLVIVYSFFYYRLLGSVIFLSLLLSGLLTYGMLVFLGREMGFTLTLAGIAGFIVSLGVAADSFVIYFERLKDEIRDGRSPRSAVPRAWARARRTIITANVISIMAAVVLYVVSVGAVRGFAFALGLATLLDLIVVFLFRHPIMTMFARTNAFLSPRVSGLGRVLVHAASDEPPSGRRRVKEA